MKLDAGLFGQSLDKMLDQLKNISDNDIGSKIDGLGAEPVGEVKITKVVGKPYDLPAGAEDDDFDPKIPGHSADPENDFDDDSNDPLSAALDEINHITGEKPDEDWLKSTGRDMKGYISQFSGVGDDHDFDDEDAFPEEKIAKLLGNKKYS